MPQKKRPRVLLVFYSRSGATRRLAKMIEERIQCDVEELADTRDRSGPIGYVRSAVDALTASLTRLQPTVHDPSEYDLVVIGTPDWMWRVSSPVLTYITENAGRFQNVAFFATYFTSGPGRVFREMAELCGRQPVATLTVRSFLMSRSHESVRRFTETIRQTQPRQAT
jgi:flavodoxin